LTGDTTLVDVREVKKDKYGLVCSSTVFTISLIKRYQLVKKSLKHTITIKNGDYDTLKLVFSYKVRKVRYKRRLKKQTTSARLLFNKSVVIATLAKEISISGCILAEQTAVRLKAFVWGFNV
jgi:hypothetical protein